MKDHLTGVPALSAGERLDAKLAAISAALDDIIAFNFSGLAPQQLRSASERLERHASRLQAARDRTIGALASSQVWAGEGSRTLQECIRDTTGASRQTSAKAVKRAEALERDLPRFRSAYEAGEISAEKVEILAQHTHSEALKEKLQDQDHGEEFLLDIAREKNADVFRRKVRTWSMQFDPQTARDAHERATREEQVSLTQLGDGWSIRGWLSQLNGEILNTALTAAMGIPTKTDSRQPMERRASALVEMACAFMNGGEAGKAATVRPHISVHVPFDLLEKIVPPAVSTLGEVERQKAGCGSGAGAECGVGAGAQCTCLRRVKRERERAGELLSVIRAGVEPSQLGGSPPATLDDGTPIWHSDVQVLLCNSEIQRVVLSQEGEVLDVGRARRLATRNQARAVIARDRTCRFPGCAHTMTSSEIHHADHWSAGGATDLNNLVMLCWYHHRFVHQKNIEITHHRNGWVFSGPGGFVGTTNHGHLQGESGISSAA